MATSNMNERENLTGADGPHFFTDDDAVDQAAWTEVEAGRYMPRRVRGSYRGRALG